MAFFGIAAVALCVGMLIVVTSLFRGFIDAYLGHVQRLLGDVVLRPSEEISDHEELLGRLEKLPGVVTARPLAQIGALLYLRPRVVKAVDLAGIDLERQCRDELFRRGLLQQAEKTAPGFSLSEKAREKARLWLANKLRRPVTDDELPTGAIVGIGVLAEPDEQTDEYDRAGIIEKDLTAREGAMVFTTGRRGTGGGAGDEGQLPAQKLSGRCWPVDVIQTGMNDVDTRVVYLPFSYVRELIGTKGPDGKVRCRASFHLTLEKGRDVTEIMAQIGRVWQEFAVETLGVSRELSGLVRIYVASQEPLVRQYTQAIRQQLFIMQLILGLICLVAALLIFVILLMVVMHKRRDIGIIRSIGSSRGQVAQIFLLYGGGIGLAGALLGLAAGVAATRNINFIEAVLARVLGFKIWRSGVYIFSEIPHEVAWGSVAWIMAAGMAAALLGALLPAWRAARMTPTQALRWE